MEVIKRSWRFNSKALILPKTPPHNLNVCVCVDLPSRIPLHFQSFPFQMGKK